MTEDFVERIRLGLYEEHQLVLFIMENLIHPSQTDWLNTERLRIEDVLNGRFNQEQELTIEAILLDWNLKLGVRVFSLGGEKLFEPMENKGDQHGKSNTSCT